MNTAPAPGSNDPNFQESLLRAHAKHQIAAMNESIQVVMFLIKLYRAFVWFMAFPGWVLTRHSFGERFLSVPLLLMGAFWMALAAMLSGSQLGMNLVLVLLGMGIAHRIQIARRNRRGDIWHSRDDGTSYLANKYPKREAIIESYVEPAFIIFLGFFALLLAHDTRPTHVPSQQMFWGNAFATYLIFVGGAMMIQASRTKKEMRNLYLDARDSQLDNEVMAKVQDRDMETRKDDAMPGGLNVARSA